jgi:hypothetical protein
MRPATLTALALLGVTLLASFLLTPDHFSAHPTGRVVDAAGPVAAVKVRLQGESLASLTDSHGRFRLPCLFHQRGRVTAWKTGYTIAAADLGSRPLELFLRPLPAADNDDYIWVDPAPDPRQANNCGNCHTDIYREWAGSGHAKAATNRRLANLMAGTDWHGRPSKQWSLLHEHPLGRGVCAACHAPTLRDPTLEYDLTRAAGVDARGVHCDYCHKIVDAPTDKLGTRFGRDGLTLLRPADGTQLFFGPLEDAHRPGEEFGYSPLYKESRYCASCHEGVIFGVHVYGTYSEWLDSPAGERGQHCQSCHMAPTGTMTNIAPGKGGIERPPATLASHHFPGATAKMLRDCLNHKIWIVPDGAGVRVEVALQPEDVGHRVPTGFIDRHLLLVVEALDEIGDPIPLRYGPRLPARAGADFAGLPGYLYGKQLLDAQERPVPFWVPAEEMVDTRLEPETIDRRYFTFAKRAEHVRVRLLYRRFWPEVAQAKSWPENEIVLIDRMEKAGRQR